MILGLNEAPLKRIQFSKNFCCGKYLVFSPRCSARFFLQSNELKSNSEVQTSALLSEY